MNPQRARRTAGILPARVPGILPAALSHGFRTLGPSGFAHPSPGLVEVAALNPTSPGPVRLAVAGIDRSAEGIILNGLGCGCVVGGFFRLRLVT